LAPFSRFFSVPRAESGERVIFLGSSRFPPRCTAGEPKSKGDNEIAISLNSIVGGESTELTGMGGSSRPRKFIKKLRKEGMPERWWTHTMQAFENIEAGKVFTG
jgi:hypothetical protein